MTFAKRFINLRFELGSGDFGADGFDAVDLTGLRVSASIQRTGGLSYSVANLQVYGASRNIMNHLTTLGQTWPDQRKNQVTVTAGDEESGASVAFSGQINEAYLDMAGAPDGVFIVTAFTGLLDALRPLPPSSFPGSAAASVIVSGLAQQMGYSFENSGVTTQLANPYFAGTGRQQLEAVARAGDFNFFVDDVASPPVLAIWPKEGSRGGEIPLIGPDTGLVGYPAYMQNALKFTCLYSPNIVFGGKVQIDSSLDPAKGVWQTYDIGHDLESETPDGKWFTNVKCLIFGSEAPLGR